MRPASWIACALALAAPLAAQAELYRWVDDRGVVNYSSIRPQGVSKVTQLDEESERVTTVPGLRPEQLARQRELELETRVARLEQELNEQRARAAAAAAAQAYPAYPVVYGGYGGYAVYPAYSYYYPAYRHRFAARAAFPPRAHAGVRHAPARSMRR